MEKDFLNIYCPNCGAPANFDIESQIYCCGRCGGKVRVEDVIRGKRELKESITQRLMESANDFSLETAVCTGCGATVIFEENEALSNCEFCGRSLVRKKYADSAKVPQSVIPFALTKKEAAKKLSEWCEQNKKKIEAQKINPRISELKGYYLPYQLVRGPVQCNVTKKGEYNRFTAYGYLTDEFVNRSKQLDNLTLDAMEPYDLNDLKEFDYAFVAGQRVKISDISDEEAARRLEAETNENYRLKMEKIWGTKAIDMKTEVKMAIQQPVLLPVYYIADGDICAAVNGQTGKVSVKAEKDSSYVEFPWWMKGIAVFMLAIGATFLGLWLGMKNLHDVLIITGYLTLYYAIIFASMFEKTDNNFISVIRYRDIFTSGETTFRRENGKLVPRDEVMKRKITEPVFLHKSGKDTVQVTYRFRSWKRVLKMVLLSIVVTFLPVITALILNGFQFSALSLSGSAVWFCIAIPVVPIYIIQFGIKSLYERPWIYTYTENGKLKRYRDKKGAKQDDEDSLPRLPFVLILFAVVVFSVSVYLTGFGG